MDLNSRRKILRTYNGKVIISENGEEGEENNKKNKLFSISIFFIEFSFYFEVLKHIVMNI